MRVLLMMSARVELFGRHEMKKERGKEHSLSILIIWNSLTQSAAQRLCTPTIFSPHFFSTTGSAQEFSPTLQHCTTVSPKND